ncbi:MAG: arsenate reductase ArsC [Elusimicrobiota bacterium]
MPVDKEAKLLKILFLCTGNSCRSQMAEGWARHLKGDTIWAYSAGIKSQGLDQRAVKVMAEAGVDISGQKSSKVVGFTGIDFDYVVTLCDHARETCPVFPGKTRIVHQGFEDPPRLAQEAKTEKEVLEHYRRIREEIKNFIQKMPGVLKK